MTSQTTQRTYDSLPEFYREADGSGVLLAFVESLVDGMGVGDADTVLQTFPDRLLTDFDTMPIEWIRWLSQHLGVQFNPTYSPIRQRLAVETATAGYRSGTVTALADAVRAGIRPFYDIEGFNYVYAEGGYYTTDDLNLLPADDAHVQQSVGGWGANVNASLSQSSDLALFGDFSLKNVVPADGVSGWLPSMAPLAASTQYTASVWVRPTATRNLRMRYTDDGGTTHEPGGYTSCPGGQWTQLLLTFTTYVGSTQGRMIVETDGDAMAGDVIYTDQACLRLGTDGTFLPSVFIDGVLDVRVRSDAFFGVGESLLEVHETGTGFAFRTANNDGTLTAVVDGNSVNSSAAAPYGQYDVAWKRFVAQDSGADKVVDFYTADDAEVIFWDALGTQQTIVGAAGAPGYANVSLLGAAGPDTPAQIHKFVDLIVRDGEDGPVVLHFEGHDEAVGTSPNITDTHGRVWGPTGAVSIDTYPEVPYVEITRHNLGDIWDIGVTTAADESPSNTALIAAAIEEAQSRPAGFTITFKNFVQTWANLVSTYPTWADWTPNTWGDLQNP